MPAKGTERTAAVAAVAVIEKSAALLMLRLKRDQCAGKRELGKCIYKS